MTGGLVPKRFQWKPLPKVKVKGTMFEDLDLTKEPAEGEDIDFALLDEMFCRPQAEIEAEEAKKKAAAAAKKAEPEARAILEPKMIQDLAMTIASLRMPATEVYEALSSLDEFALKDEQIEKVRIMIPSLEIQKQLEDNRASFYQLTTQEQYLLEILRLPGITAHMQCLEIKTEFSERFLQLNKNLTNLRAAVLGVENNKEFRNVIVMILKIGNYLNQGTNKGNSVSFSVELFNNLKLNKATGAHSKSTMMDYLLSTILNKCPSNATFALKLADCKDARAIDLSLLQDQLNSFIRQQDTVKEAIEEKQKGASADRALMAPLVEKEDNGELEAHEEQEIDRL